MWRDLNFDFIYPRFEVLEQVCSCAEVLGNVVSEVERRQAFNQLFTEVQCAAPYMYMYVYYTYA